MFPMEFLTKELQKSQPTYFSNIFLSEVFSIEKNNGAGGIYNINVGNYIFLYYSLSSSVSMYFAFH